MLLFTIIIGKIHEKNLFFHHLSSDLKIILKIYFCVPVYMCMYKIRLLSIFKENAFHLIYLQIQHCLLTLSTK